MSSADLQDDAQVERQPLNLQVQVASPSACQRHITVTVSHDDIQTYFTRAVKDLVPTAAIPGFRQGRAPKKLVESRFKKEVADQVKGSILVDSIAQVTESEKLSAISEPDFDPSAVTLPEEGPLTFEFDIEVRPEFDLPEWKGLKLERPTHEFSEKDVDNKLEHALAQWGRLVPLDGPAQPNDYIACNLSFKADGQDLSASKDEILRLRPTLSFRDGKIEGFDTALAGVKAGETREVEATISDNAPNAALRGKKATASFEVLEVKRLELPELTPAFLDSVGFSTEAELRDEVRKSLEKQFEYYQRQQLRRQITSALLANANWELPPDLLNRQSRRELQRAVLELQRGGFNAEEIRAHENELRQNSQITTARALKEHFILERIAETASIDASDDDYDQEIRMIAEQSDESPRRVRARLEKNNTMDALRNQIIERKVIDLVLEGATFKNIAYQPPGMAQVEAINSSVSGPDEESAIPEAQHADVQETPKGHSDRVK